MMSYRDVVISGIAGRFPNSDNVREFSYNLYNKVDMIDDADTRWKNFNDRLPQRCGKVRNIEKFDSGAFQTGVRQANATDPQARILTEHCYEAILDAGISPRSLVGSNTGVFVGCSSSDSKESHAYHRQFTDGSLVANTKYMLSNGISFALGLNGPSMTVDTACSASGYALDVAFKYLQSGSCDQALVCGTQLNLCPEITLGYVVSAGDALDRNGISRPFDENANGFVRAETICAVFLQKSSDAKRVYAQLVYTKSNNDGFKTEGFYYPSKIMHKKLISSFYKDINIDPSTISYVEAHATGTVAGDPQESWALDEVFCKDRTSVLPIGSVKSNIGHAESASTMASLAKVLFTLENKMIPPNINLKNLRQDIKGLVEGRMRVVTEPEPLDGPLVAINSFGIVGANAHILLRGNEKVKVNKGVPADDLGRLLLWAGRTPEAVNNIFDDITSRPLDAEHIALMQNSQLKTSKTHQQRGFGVFKQDTATGMAVCVKRDVQISNNTKRPIVFMFSGVGSQWAGMAAGLMEVPIFARSIERCHALLKPMNVDLKNILTSTKVTFDVLNTFIGIIAMQIGLTDVLKAVGIKPDHIIGHSVGELGCAYADESLSLEETILAAYYRGMACKEANVIEGKMAVVGKTLDELREIKPVDIDIACHNSSNLFTISGPAKSIDSFVSKLSDEKIFARHVESPLPFHSRYIASVGPILRKKLNEILPEPKKRSPKWLSTCIPQDEWDHPDSQLSSADYHTRNLLSPVLFAEVCELLPANSLLIEIAPHGLLKAIVTRSMPTSVHISLTQKGSENSSLTMSEGLGRLFQAGLDINVAKLYPQVNFPVSVGTPMISPNIKWDHSDDCYVPFFDHAMINDRRRVSISLMDPHFSFLRGHMVDGKVLFPGTGYAFLAWETFAMMMGIHYSKARIQIDDLQFLRATTLTESTREILTVSITKGSNTFAILDGSTLVATGSIKLLERPHQFSSGKMAPNGDFPILTNEDFQKVYGLKGYNYSGLFNSIQEISGDGNYAKIKWEDNWMAYMDSLLQMTVVRKHTKLLTLPKSIRKMVIDPEVTLQMVKDAKAESDDVIIEAVIDENLDVCRTAGVEIWGVEGFEANRRMQNVLPVLESYKFVPHFPTPELTALDTAKFCLQLVSENSNMKTLKLVECDDGRDPIATQFYNASMTTPLISIEANYLTAKEGEIKNVTVHNEGDLSAFTDANVVIDLRPTPGKTLLQTIQTSFDDRCFILCRSLDQSEQFWQLFPHFRCIASIQMKAELVDLVYYNVKRKPIETTANIVEIPTDYDNYGWLKKVQESNANEKNLIIFSQKANQSGVLGLANCLFREPNGHQLTCVLIDDDKAPRFDLENAFYKKQLSLGIKMNVLHNGKWGSYRHMPLTTSYDKSITNTFSHADSLAIGDFSKFTWVKRIDDDSEYDVEICFAPLNFRDVMVMSGKIANFAMKDKLKEQAIIGLEFSGMFKGRRIMGILDAPGALATRCKSSEVTYWNIPDGWTLEEASTVPIVYSTVYLAFFKLCQIKKGDSVLIHAGSGGVGLAAIYVALAYGLEIFTTVSTKEKRDYLLETFPALNPDNIGNSRDCSFEEMVMTNTKGRGVDYVLNSLSEEKLIASLRCVAEDGFFLEIGKYDMAKGSLVRLSHFKRGASFQPVLFKADDAVYDFITNDLASGVIKPLKPNVFKSNQLEQAFRYLASGKHMGKVVLDVQHTEDHDEASPISVTHRQFFNTKLCHVIVGGLGGFGLELAEWLIQRGVEKLVLNSRRGITAPYQTYKINHWKKYGVTVVTNTYDSTTREGCKLLLQKSTELGEVGGIWNLAVNLSDGMFTNQNEETFMKCFKPKVHATVNLSEVSQQLCKKLKHFVAFSSVSCGFGNPGQTNYAMANSIIERIAEKRRELGLPAKVIQWGPIGDVGVAAHANMSNVLKLAGIDIQPIQSCIQVLDELLVADDPIVSSMIAAKADAYGVGKKTAKEIIMNALGIRDPSSVAEDAILGDLGMDSMITVEVSQILARDYDVRLSPDEVKHLKVSELEKLATKGSSGTSNKDGLNLSNVFSENTLKGITSDELIVQLKSAATASANTKILIIPSFEGYVLEAWKEMAKGLKHQTYFLQYESTFKCSGFEEIVDVVSGDVMKIFEDVDKFLIVGHSFGCMLALRLAEMLEAKKKVGKVVNVDGSPLFVHKWTNFMFPSDASDENVKQIIATGYARRYMNDDAVIAEVIKQKTFDLQIKKISEFIMANTTMNVDAIQREIESQVSRLRISRASDTLTFAKLSTTTLMLVKAATEIVPNLPNDYGLQQYSTKNVTVHTLEGDHSTIIQNQKLQNLVESEASFMKSSETTTMNGIEIKRDSKKLRHQGNVH